MKNNNTTKGEKMTNGTEIHAGNRSEHTIETPQETATRVHEFCEYHRAALEQSLADM